MRKFVVYPGNNPEVIKKALLLRGNWEDVTEERSNYNLEHVFFVWKPTNLPIRVYAQMDTEETSNMTQIINHFENNRCICTKTGLIRSLRQFYSHWEPAVDARYNVHETIPTSFILTAGHTDMEYANFVERFKELENKKFTKEIVPEKHCRENMWIVKPADQNQGRGIEIFKKLGDIDEFLNNQVKNTYWVAQKYIEKPLLYNGRKFDVRMWVLVTWKNEIFYYKEPYMRTSSSNYTFNDLNNYVHLTNNCLQKNGDEFGKFEEGNTLPLSMLQEYLDSNYAKLDIKVKQDIIPRMTDMIIDSIMSVRKQLNPNKRKHCFELFGYDFLIDEDLRTWLLEINSNPYLGGPNQFIKDLLPKMVDDMLSIVLDHSYTPKNVNYYRKSLEETGFRLIYCERDSLYSKPVNHRKPLHSNIYPIVQFYQPHRVRGGSIDIKCEHASHQHFRVKDKCCADFCHKPETDCTNPVSFKKGFSPFSSSNNTPNNKPKKNPPHQTSGTSIELTVKNIEYYIDQFYLDTDPIIPLLERIIYLLLNWELHSDKDISLACNAMKMVAESKAMSAMAEPALIERMVELIDSPNVPVEIQLKITMCIVAMSRRLSEKKRIVNDALIHALVRISMASCNAVLVKNYDKKIISLAIEGLISLSGRFQRKNFIPGETRDMERVRFFFMTQGGLFALFIISKAAVDADFKQQAESYLPTLELPDWEFQKQVIDLALQDLAKGIKIEKSDERKPPIFLFEFSQISPRGKRKKSIEGPTGNHCIPVSANFPWEQVIREDVTLQEMAEEFNVLIEKVKEEQVQKAIEEERRKEREKEEAFQLKIDIEKSATERRKKAEQEFLKRLEDKRKENLEAMKRIEEDLKQRVLEEEVRREQKKVFLLKKREEFLKKQKEEVLKKKKLDEENKLELEKLIKSREIKRMEYLQKRAQASLDRSIISGVATQGTLDSVRHVDSTREKNNQSMIEFSDVDPIPRIRRVIKPKKKSAVDEIILQKLEFRRNEIRNEVLKSERKEYTLSPTPQNNQSQTISHQPSEDKNKILPSLMKLRINNERINTEGNEEKKSARSLSNEPPFNPPLTKRFAFLIKKDKIANNHKDDLYNFVPKPLGLPDHNTSFVRKSRNLTPMEPVNISFDSGVRIPSLKNRIDLRNILIK